MGRSDESTPVFDFAVTDIDRVVRAPAAAHHWVWLHAALLCKLARGPEDFINVLHAMGLPVPFILGWATIIVELVGGLIILIGALIPLATVPMAIVLLVAIFTVHLPNGFSSIKLQSFDAAGAHFGQPGYETDLLYLAGLVALCLGGPGPISIDGLLNRLTMFGAASASQRQRRANGRFG